MENRVLDHITIPQLIFFFILTTCPRYLIDIGINTPPLAQQQSIDDKLGLMLG